MRFMDNIDLFKSKRDTSKLVQVQRTVSRQGTTFVQNFWVRPSDVRSNDRVVGGHQNLLPKQGSVTKPPSGVLDSKYFDTIKTDKKAALDYLKSCGITWKEHSHAGINWMRAMQSYSSSLSGTTTNKTSLQSNVQSQPKLQQGPQISQPGGDVQTIVLTDTQKDEVDSGSNGKEKAVILKKLLGNDKCIEFAKQLGVKWEENSFPAINIMRMSMALRSHFDLVDGTTSPVNTKSKKKGGAPKDNHNAKKDDVTIEVPKDTSLVEVPKDATQSQINIISLINNISSESDLETYKLVGMIPEDEVSKSFIKDKMSPKYSLFKAAHSSEAKASKVKNKVRNNVNSPRGFADQLSHTVEFQGCKKEIIGSGLVSLYCSFDMGLLVAPRDSISSEIVSSRTGIVKLNRLEHILHNLSQYSTYATEEYDDDQSKTILWPTSMGYRGWDSSVYKKRYDHNNEGFTKAISRIAKENPDLKSKCDQMISQYDDLMKVVDYNPSVLKMYLGDSTWTDADDSGSDLVRISKFEAPQYNSVYYNMTPSEAKVTLSVVKYQIKSIPEALRSLGYTYDDIKSTLGWRNSWNRNISNFDVEKADGTRESVDLTSALDSKGVPYFKDVKSDGYKDLYTTQTCRTVLEMINDELNGTHVSDGWEKIKRAEVSSNMNFEDFKKVHELSAGLFGLKYVKDSGENLDWSSVTPQSVSGFRHGRQNEYSLASTSDDTLLDKVISNIHMMSLMHDVNKDIASEVNQNSSTKLNDYGTDFSKNFSYYHPDNGEISRSNKRLKTESRMINRPPVSFSGAKEINDQVETQITSVPLISSSQLEDIMSYYSAASTFSDAGSAARNARFSSLGIDFSKYKDSPLKDILFKTTCNVASFVPKMSDSKTTDKLNDWVAKRLDYVPYDYKGSVQHTYSELHTPKKKVVGKDIQSNKLLQLRKDVLKSTHCTISVEDESVSLQMRKDFIKNWDYDGVDHPKIYSGSKSHRGADRRALFNSRFFKVNNSSFETRFQEYMKSLGQTPEEHYHATSYASTAGILGAEGGWQTNGGYMKTAQALGAGAYFGRKGGKSSVYCGEGSGGYHNLDIDGDQGDRANGCYILTSVIHGKPEDSRVSNSFREYEIVVKNNACLLPHHFVDVSCRSLGVNVKRDSNGNYLDNDGNMSHDKYGQKVDMK